MYEQSYANGPLYKFCGILHKMGDYANDHVEATMYIVVCTHS
jgi:hypothetical protein